VSSFLLIISVKRTVDKDFLAFLLIWSHLARVLIAISHITNTRQIFFKALNLLKLKAKYGIVNPCG
jgi:hypothetical protein